MTATVRYEREGAVARITFDHPAARNAMTWSMYEQLSECLTRLSKDATARVAVLRGSGGHFVSGTDITQFSDFSSGDDGVAYERRLEALVAQLERVSIPTIAVIEGNAAGAGLLIATACDIRVCTPDAVLSVPIARTVGNTLALGAIARLVASLGISRTKALLMTAGTIEAAEARAAGFVSTVIAPDQLDEQLGALVKKVSGLAPLTLTATKRIVEQVVDVVVAEAADDIVREVYGSRDFREGVSAFTEKRRPAWEGR